MQRTLWAEKFVNGFSSIPLTAEFVFYSPQYLDRGIQKEVCDFLLVLRGSAILISMKTQDDPSSKSGDKLSRWTIKNATSALNQAGGALKTLARGPFWCQHSRRGRVDFKQASICVSHVVVLTEVFDDIVELPSDLPLQLGSISVTYLSLNDFLNLINELRAFPDITAYLDARRTLPPDMLRLIGHEAFFYKYYILNDGSLSGCGSYTDTKIFSAFRDAEWQNELFAAHSRRKSASLIEFVSDALATRLKNFADGLDAQTAAYFDPADDRKNYLNLQEELCDLQLKERSALGDQFALVIDKVKKSEETEDMSYMAFRTDSKPDLVYVLVSAKGIDRTTLLGRLAILLQAAMVAYGNDRGYVIADRDGVGFEVQMISGRPVDPVYGKLAEELFSKLKVSHIPLS